MSNYTKTTDFEAKDSLPTGDSGKIIRGAEFETEFDAISTAIATKADTAGPTFTGTLTFDTISDGTIGVTAFVDEDDMVSNSATLVPTQQSVKAYVDAVTTELNAQDLDFQGDTGGALSIDLDSESLTVAGGTGIDTAGLGNTLTVNIDSTVATLTGTQTLTNKTLTTPVISGNLTTDGTIDGRDVAADGTKLDGIESGATADQTDAEIRAAVEAATDSNVFTDADHTKLDGIEAGADVTDTTNVTAAGAVMDSELTSEASVKALNQGVATTDSPTFAGLTTTADVSFGDNDKATFGAGSDLQIYHDGSNSYITDSGTGNLNIRGQNQIDIENVDGSQVYARFNLNGETLLTHAGVEKFATTSTGVDVTGTVTADAVATGASTFTGSLTIDAAAASVTVKDSNDGGTTGYVFSNSSGNTSSIRAQSNGQAIEIKPNEQISALFDSGGDISFYEDTGTTAKLTWDASAETLNFADNGKAVFGAGSDLQIYHDGVSRIKELGAGGLYVDVSNDMYIRRNDTSAVMAEFNAGVAKLMFDGSQKLATTTTGIDVTGTVTADGLTVGNGTQQSRFYIDADEVSQLIDGNVRYDIWTGGDKTMRLDANGDISFYEDTGTTAKLFWDASAESLGIGTTTPNYLLDIESSGALFRINATSGDAAAQLSVADTTSLNTINFGDSGSTTAGQIIYRHNGDSMAFNVAGAEAIRLANGGNVGIGTSSPSTALHVNSGATNEAARFESTDTEVTLELKDTTGTAKIKSRADFRFETGATPSEAMRIDSSGNLLVGKTSVSGGIAGAVLAASGLTRLTASGIAVAEINRLSSDGSIVDFKKDSTTVGSIGAKDGDLTIGTNDTGVRFYDGGNAVYPVNASTQAGLDATIDLGRSDGGGTFRFKDLYLSGDVSLANDSHISFASTACRIEGTSSGADFIKFITNSNEGFRLDSSGNLLVGKTSTGTGTVGAELRANGFNAFVRDGGEVFNLNRLTSDGTIIDFRKDSATVGSIGATNGDLAIGTGNTKLRFDDASDAIHAGGGDGSGTNAGTDLGTATYKFGDLYLSGGAYLGGTAAANKLDDYEEGTFTPTLTAFSANGTPTYTTQHGSYVKVGNLVHIQIYLTWSNWTGYSGYMKFGGLPFTVKTATSYGYSSATLGYANNFSWGGTNAHPSLHFRPSNTEIFIGYSVSGGGWTNSPVDTSGDIIVSGTYFAA